MTSKVDAIRRTVPLARADALTAMLETALREVVAAAADSVTARIADAPDSLTLASKAARLMDALADRTSKDTWPSGAAIMALACEVVRAFKRAIGWKPLRVATCAATRPASDVLPDVRACAADLIVAAAAADTLADVAAIAFVALLVRIAIKAIGRRSCREDDRIVARAANKTDPTIPSAPRAATKDAADREVAARILPMGDAAERARAVIHDLKVPMAADLAVEFALAKSGVAPLMPPLAWSDD